MTNLSFGVIIVETFLSKSVANLMSRLVTRPTSFFPFTTGTPEKGKSFINSINSLIDEFGPIVTGSFTMPLSYFLT